MGIEWGQEQCQWCDEKNQLIAAYKAQANESSSATAATTAVKAGHNQKESNAK
jgi:hypothetical protein